jgi:hypothetical protein
MSLTDIKGLPRRSRGRQLAATQAAYEPDIPEFAEFILEMHSRLDFAVSARGWVYIR